MTSSRSTTLERRKPRFPRAASIVRNTKGMSTAKLLLPAAASSRPILKKPALALFNMFSQGDLVKYSYAIAGKPITGVLRKSNVFSDFQSALELAVGDCYHLHHLPTPTQIIDGGANTGLFSLAAAARWPSAAITAFEPVTENIDVVRTHLKLNKFEDTVSLAPYALGANSRQATFFIREANQGSMADDVDYSEQITVDVVPIADYIKQDEQGITLIKLDIEGAEMECLPEVFKKLPKGGLILVMELHDAPKNMPTVEDMAKKEGAILEVYEKGSNTAHVRIHTPNIDLKPLNLL